MKERSMLRTLAALVFAAPLAACSSAVSPGDASTDASSPAQDAVVVADAATDAVVATDVIAVPDATPEGYVEGWAEAVTYVTPDAPPSSLVDAMFNTLPSAPSCTARPVGACTLRHCRYEGPWTYGVSAGELSVSDTAHAARLVLPYPGPMISEYVSARETGARWPAGTEITFAASGDVVPPFHAIVAFPPTSALVGFNPTYDDRAVVIDRSRDLELDWMPVAGTALTVRLTLDGTLTDDDALECSFPSGSGHAVVPAATLGMLPATAPDSAEIDIALANDSTQGRTNAVIHVRAAVVLFAGSAELN